MKKWIVLLLVSLFVMPTPGFVCFLVEEKEKKQGGYNCRGSETKK